MRQILVLIIVGAAISSCSVVGPGMYSATAIDYKRFNDQGFFITESNSVNFEYTPISSVSALFTNGWIEKEVVDENKPKKLKRHKDDVYNTEGPKMKQVYVRGTPDGVTDLLVEEAMKMGGDGIINFKYSAEVYIDKDGNAKVYGWSASGMAIKR
ncbi:MAG TPA: hypothetical protein VNQ80_12435 [Parapedobacter sp.]|uniref:hypothetical protein n=1 Tax=Parapedobacter sp. TaxID=1958893 RepID=UPI002C8E4098|nr:hypothetical protein [Parapedobacter sp.]HWK58145.1 hypothetical protein [Parapedobacter sp.]